MPAPPALANRSHECCRRYFSQRLERVGVTIRRNVFGIVEVAPDAHESEAGIDNPDSELTSDNGVLTAGIDDEPGGDLSAIGVSLSMANDLYPFVTKHHSRRRDFFIDFSPLRTS